MRRAAKSLPSLLALLAAVTTVVAGVPTVQCRCPDGRVKAFCTSTLPAQTGCCCAPKPANQPAPEAEPSCCHEQGPAPARGDTTPRLTAPSCVKTLIGGEAVASAEPTPSPVLSPADVAFGAVVVPAAPPALPATAVRPRDRSPGPPPDLVVQLCHFTI